MIKNLMRKLNAKRHASIKNSQKRLLVRACEINNIECGDVNEVIDNQKVTPNIILN